MAIPAKDFINYAQQLQKANCTGVCWDFAVGFNRLLLRKTPAQLPDSVRTFNFNNNGYPATMWENIANRLMVGDVLVIVYIGKYTQHHFAVALGDSLFGWVCSFSYDKRHLEPMKDYENKIAVVCKFIGNPILDPDRMSFVHIPSKNVDGFVKALG